MWSIFRRIRSAIGLWNRIPRRAQDLIFILIFLMGLFAILTTWFVVLVMEACR